MRISYKNKGVVKQDQSSRKPSHHHLVKDARWNSMTSEQQKNELKKQTDDQKAYAIGAQILTGHR